MNTNNRTWIMVIAACVALAAAGLTLAGCPTDDAGGGGPGNNNNGGGDGYTVKFKIENASTDVAITKIEFLDYKDWDNENDSATVRSTITEPLAAGITKEYSVDGFIKHAGQIHVEAIVHYTDGTGTAQTAEDDYTFQTEEEKADPKKKFTFTGSSLSYQSTY